MRSTQTNCPGLEDLLALLPDGDPVAFAELAREWEACVGAEEVGRLLELALGADSMHEVQDLAWLLLAEVAGPELTDRVAGLVGSPSDSVWLRGRAIRVLAGIAERHEEEASDAARALLPLLGSGSCEIRDAVARALGRIPDPAARAACLLRPRS